MKEKNDEYIINITMMGGKQLGCQVKTACYQLRVHTNIRTDSRRYLTEKSIPRREGVALCCHA